MAPEDGVAYITRLILEMKTVTIVPTSNKIKAHSKGVYKIK